MQRDKAVELLINLLNAGVPLIKWGAGECKSLEDFIIEIDNRESIVKFDSYNKVIRYIRTILLDIYYKNPANGDVYVLVEEKQTLKGNRPRTRKGQASVSETLVGDEAADIKAISRALHEELNIPAGLLNLKFKGKTREPLRESISYPGVKTSSEDHRFEVRLWDFQYKTEGYTETRDGITTKFVWKLHKKADED